MLILLYFSEKRGIVMDYNVVRAQAVDAFKYYKNDDKKYRDSMTKLYAEGKSNPTVTKVILDNTVSDKIGRLSQISSEVMRDARTPDFYPLCDHFGQIDEFNARANIALMSMKRSLDVSDMPNDKSLNDLAEKKVFDEKFNELYPRTGKIRERIIDAHRIKMDEVTPKDSWSNKITYAKTNGEYRELYPKSFLTRMSLIIKGQIRDNEVTKRVSGFFSRLSYFPTVDKSFSFLKQIKK